MDYLQMTSPCGLACFNCHFYLANENEESLEILKMYSRLEGIPVETMLCKGCRNQEGVLALHEIAFGRTEPCGAYKCSREKQIDFCHECPDFPCDHLHPYADRADKVPHNTKVFNLCLIKKLGVAAWAEKKAAAVHETYFHKWWHL